MSKSTLNRLRGMVQMVYDLVFDDDGNATCKSVGDDQEEDSYSPTVGYHFGFYSRPLDGARGVVLKADGHGNTSFLFGFRDKQYEISLSKGEVGIQNAFSASILLNKDGEIVLNGGGAKIGRVGDAVNLGKFTHVPASGAGVTPCKLLWSPPGATGDPTEVTAATELDGEIKEGADKVKA